MIINDMEEWEVLDVLEVLFGKKQKTSVYFNENTKYVVEKILGNEIKIYVESDGDNEHYKGVPLIWKKKIDDIISIKILKDCEGTYKLVIE